MQIFHLTSQPAETAVLTVRRPLRVWIGWEHYPDEKKQEIPNIVFSSTTLPVRSTIEVSGDTRDAWYCADDKWLLVRIFDMPLNVERAHSCLQEHSIETALLHKASPLSW